jgi:hypothetical protein
MSILKGILHHWNKTNKAYDTIHPETESAQVTDWNSGIVGTLASTALGSLVTTLSSDSLLAKLIEKVLSATGVKYQTGQNGYLCLGSLFGGLIIQWGIVTCGTSSARTGATVIATFPVAFSRGCYVISSNLVDGKTQNENWDGVTTWADSVTLTTMRIIATARFAMYSPLVSYIAIGA